MHTNIDRIVLSVKNLPNAQKTNVVQTVAVPLRAVPFPRWLYIYIRNGSISKNTVENKY